MGKLGIHLEKTRREWKVGRSAKGQQDEHFQRPWESPGEVGVLQRPAQCLDEKQATGWPPRPMRGKLPCDHSCRHHNFPPGPKLADSPQWKVGNFSSNIVGVLHWGLIEQAIQCTDFEVCSSMSFDKCNLRSHHLSQGIELLAWRVPLCFTSQATPTPSPGNHCSDFYHSRLILSVFELHLNKTIQCVLLCVCFLSLNMLLRFIRGVCSFFSLSSIS